MDDQAMKIGMLMETAHSQQAVATEAIQKLSTHVQQIGELVRTETRDALTDNIRLLQVEARSATDSLRAIKRAGNLHAALWSALFVVLNSLVALAATWWSLPSRAELAGLRSQRDALAASIRTLSEQGGRVDLRRCGAKRRLCVHIDRKAPRFGESGDYLIVEGY